MQTECLGVVALFLYDGKENTKVLQRFTKLVSQAPTDSIRGDLENPQDWFAGFGFLEVLDLILVAAILVGLVLYLMNRRAGKMILGGFFITLALGICYLIGFPILSAFAEGVFSVFLVVLLILFHDELREIMREIGCIPEKIASFFKKRTAHGISRKTARVIDEVCDAVAQMSASHTGALIVLRRASGLREYSTKAQIINAEVNSALIRNVFFDKSPLHDGAMIIEGGKIHAASCQLPPADPEGIDASLGERHKAALGISGCTDAVVVVVSEQTGTISIALADEMKRGYSKEELHAELTTLLGNYNAKLEDWGEGSSLTFSTVRKHKKPEKEKSSTGAKQ